MGNKVTAEEYESCVIDNSDFRQVMKKRRVALYIDHEDYESYLKGAVAAHNLVIFIRSIGQYVVRAPDGGCWLFSRMVFEFLAGHATSLPRSGNRIPRTASVNLASALTYSANIRSIFVNKGETGHMVAVTQPLSFENRLI